MITWPGSPCRPNRSPEVPAAFSAIVGVCWRRSRTAAIRAPRGCSRSGPARDAYPPGRSGTFPPASGTSRCGCRADPAGRPGRRARRLPRRFTRGGGPLRGAGLRRAGGRQDRAGGHAAPVVTAAGGWFVTGKFDQYRQVGRRRRPPGPAGPRPAAAGRAGSGVRRAAGGAARRAGPTLRARSRHLPEFGPCWAGPRRADRPPAPYAARSTAAAWPASERRPPTRLAIVCHGRPAVGQAPRSVSWTPSSTDAASRRAAVCAYREAEVDAAHPLWPCPAGATRAGRRWPSGSPTSARPTSASCSASSCGCRRATRARSPRWSGIEDAVERFPPRAAVQGQV